MVCAVRVLARVDACLPVPFSLGSPTFRFWTCEGAYRTTYTLLESIYLSLRGCKRYLRLAE